MFLGWLGGSKKQIIKKRIFTATVSDNDCYNIYQVFKNLLVSSKSGAWVRHSAPYLLFFAGNEKRGDIKFRLKYGCRSEMAPEL